MIANSFATWAEKLTDFFGPALKVSKSGKSGTFVSSRSFATSVKKYFFFVYVRHQNYNIDLFIQKNNEIYRHYGPNHLLL